MRNIPISTAVFAHIWSHRREGEDTEDAILRRMFGLKVAMPTVPSNDAGSKQGYYSKRFDVQFPEGFEMFRTFKGTNFCAKATNGRWLLISNNKAYGSLRELSEAVGAKIENSWMNWFFHNSSGERKPISILRPKDRVSRRTAR